jgi:ribose 1,5-bisphosphokinase
MPGQLFFVVGPSGAGKDTLLAGAVAADPTLYWARRVISRPQSLGGEPYEGVTEAQFQHRLAQGEFALYWQAHGLWYGVTHSALAPLQTGDVLLNGSRAALPMVRRIFPNLCVVLITAPVQVLAERLALRGRETAGVIEARLNRTVTDMPMDASVIVIQNDKTPEIGVKALVYALRGKRCTS